MSLQLQTLPHLLVEIDGTALPIEEKRRLWSVRVQQRLSLPALCELSFLEPTDAMMKGDVLSAGSNLRVRTSATDEPLFTGQVTAIEHIYEPSRGREVRVRGYDVLHQLRKRQPVRAHLLQTLADLV